MLYIPVSSVSPGHRFSAEGLAMYCPTDSAKMCWCSVIHPALDCVCQQIKPSRYIEYLNIAFTCIQWASFVRDSESKKSVSNLYLE